MILTCKLFCLAFILNKIVQKREKILSLLFFHFMIFRNYKANSVSCINRIATVKLYKQCHVKWCETYGIESYTVKQHRSRITTFIGYNFTLAFMQKVKLSNCCQKSNDNVQCEKKLKIRLSNNVRGQKSKHTDTSKTNI